jgi:peptide chain release factor 3
VILVLRDRDLGDQAPVLAAVGPMQFEVALYRL